MLQDLIKFQVMTPREICIQQKWKIKKARRNAEKIGYYGHWEKQRYLSGWKHKTFLMLFLMYLVKKDLIDQQDSDYEKWDRH